MTKSVVSCTILLSILNYVDGAVMLLKSIKGDISPEEFEELVVAEFRKLRASLYELLPEDCLLKPRKVLTGEMASLLDEHTLSQGLIVKEDICALCNENTCPHFVISDREARVCKINFYHEALLDDNDTKLVS